MFSKWSLYSMSPHPPPMLSSLFSPKRVTCPARYIRHLIPKQYLVSSTDHESLITYSLSDVLCFSSGLFEA